MTRIVKHLSTLFNYSKNCHIMQYSHHRNQSSSLADIALSMPLFLRNLFLDHLDPIIILRLQIVFLSYGHRSQLPLNIPIIRLRIEMQSSDVRDYLLEL